MGFATLQATISRYEAAVQPGSGDARDYLASEALVGMPGSLTLRDCEPHTLTEDIFY